jgi:hypothetical protein
MATELPSTIIPPPPVAAMSANVRCPACGANVQPKGDLCESCGFVFASYVPLPSVPGPASTQVGGGYTGRPLQPGQRLDGGRYTVRGPLSRGGMGALYLAVDHCAFERSVAIKALLGPSDEERLAYEARMLAALRHPAIPQIFGYIQEKQQSYIAMQHVEGASLQHGLTQADEGISGQPYPLEQTLAWGAQICGALEYLASRRPYPVVHRDIKPANLVLDDASGALFLVDFGAATSVWPGRPDGAHQEPFGTPGYAPPEQYRGEAEPRSDVYALAATLYHLLTDDDPSLHPFAFPQLDRLGDASEVLRAALHPDPAQRPEAATLRRQLEVLRSLSTTPTLISPDGTVLDSERALTAWCERSWVLAEGWLRGGLPAQVERWRGERLAQQLRDLVRRHADAGAALDATLALLDPAEFGVAAPRLVAATTALDFGTVPKTPAVCQLTIANVGRRYVSAHVTTPKWITAATTQIVLAPGSQISLKLNAERRRGRVQRSMRDTVRVISGGNTLVECKVRATC